MIVHSLRFYGATVKQKFYTTKYCHHLLYNRPVKMV
ncbi:hypothetical protein Glov_3437 [Trichlorobacter lovleyi SZ]|uniref:Uncharacterized protein n=1 Tax=Trichlorobacter lovleyi (strain ATCC BAA-1151 / DSM 17278 / SZ) TaxID=398767 RepID=B3E238_TRIL1|nr:hypothetical protein Glov_3437 [Trichlorobacter lovleyi SZ]